ncbi:uncharacterized protein LOC111058477 [Nilaparvata lugens]|uniref:uncharacterized protein LOC111058477 n=1 Tax=Nilaparvata lugens TaxID=108931 RepID=UPI00193CB29A|nr:uncharacterized protein LOC111058477 [Nilaparvata lugens]
MISCPRYIFLSVTTLSLWASLHADAPTGIYGIQEIVADSMHENENQLLTEAFMADEYLRTLMPQLITDQQVSNLKYVLSLYAEWYVVCETEPSVKDFGETFIGKLLTNDMLKDFKANIEFRDELFEKFLVCMRKEEKVYKLSNLIDRIGNDSRYNSTLRDALMQRVLIIQMVMRKPRGEKVLYNKLLRVIYDGQFDMIFDKYFEWKQRALSVAMELFTSIDEFKINLKNLSPLEAPLLL